MDLDCLSTPQTRQLAAFHPYTRIPNPSTNPIRFRFLRDVSTAVTVSDVHHFAPSPLARITRDRINADCPPRPRFSGAVAANPRYPHDPSIISSPTDTGRAPSNAACSSAWPSSTSAPAARIPASLNHGDVARITAPASLRGTTRTSNSVRASISPVTSRHTTGYRTHVTSTAPAAANPACVPSSHPRGPIRKNTRRFPRPFIAWKASATTSAATGTPIPTHCTRF